MPQSLSFWQFGIQALNFLEEKCGTFKMFKKMSEASNGNFFSFCHLMVTCNLKSVRFKRRALEKACALKKRGLKRACAWKGVRLKRRAIEKACAWNGVRSMAKARYAHTSSYSLQCSIASSQLVSELHGFKHEPSEKHFKPWLHSWSLWHFGKHVFSWWLQV